MNRLINLEHTHDIDTILGELKIGDQLVVDNGELMYRHLCSMPVHCNHLMINTAKSLHPLVTEYIQPMLRANNLVGWEIGRVNKTTPSVTQYNLIAMLLKNGQMLIIRPRRSAIALRNGNLTRQRCFASAEELSKLPLVEIGKCFTDIIKHPSVNPYLHWSIGSIEPPSNAVKVVQLCMTSTVDLSGQTPVASHVLNGILHPLPE